MRLFLVPVLVLFSSASLQAQDKKRCADTPIDSTNPASPVYRDCHVQRKVKYRRSTLRPEFTPSPSGPSCYRATFEFVVDTSGRPEVATIRRIASTDQQYADAVEATIGGLLFEPAQIDKAPVRQLLRHDSRASVRRVVMSSSGGPPSGASPNARVSRTPNC